MSVSLLILSCNQNGGDIVKPKTTTTVTYQLLTPNPSDAVKAYQDWKKIFVTQKGCPKGGSRVLFDDGSSTVSEGIGYGLLASAFMKDQALFDSLLTYYVTHLDSYGLMNWKIGSDGSTLIGRNAATDADEDVAMSLLVADRNWGTTGKYTYKDWALRVINSLSKYTVEKGTYVLKPGDVWGGSTVTNPSYFAPAYYKLFYEATQDSTWLLVADKCYEILTLAMDPTTGLVPDWCMATGQTPAADRSDGTTYSYDACRTPWRIAVDYAWNKDDRAKTYCAKIRDFVSKVGVGNIGDGYSLSGQPTSTYSSTAFVGSFGCAVIVLPDSEQELINQFYTRNEQTGTTNYYNSSLRVLTLLFQTGYWQKPG